MTSLRELELMEKGRERKIEKKGRKK